MRPTTIAGLLLGSSIALTPPPAWCGGGDLDRTFGTPGRVTTAIAPKALSSADFDLRDGYEDGMAVVTDTAGRLVVVGSSWNGADFDVAVARYLPDGRLDTSFGAGGTRTTAIGPSTDFGVDVAIDPLGRIVVAARSRIGASFDFAVVRYTANGNLDTSFSGDGKVTTAMGSASADHARAVAVDSSGRIIVAGVAMVGATNTVDSYLALARYTATGALDSSFSGDGKLTAIGNPEVGDVLVDPSGRVVVAGSVQIGTGTNHDVAVWRYTTNGTPDTTFSNDGVVLVPIGTGNDDASAVTVGTDGKILVAGSAQDPGSYSDTALVRFHGNGTLDTTFGAGGRVRTSTSPGHDSARAVRIDASGRIVVAGSALVRYTANGSLDGSFGVGGIVAGPLSSAVGRVEDVLVDTSGRIVVAGWVEAVTAGYEMSVARYTPNGVADPTFGGGVATPIFASRIEYPQAVAIDGSGRPVAAGYVYADGKARIALTRHTATGSLDPSFSADGMTTTNIRGSLDTASAVAVDAKGRIVVAGSSFDGSKYDFAAVRYTPTGGFDTSFSGDGMVTTTLGFDGAIGTATAIDTKNRVVIAGLSWNGLNYDFGVVRFTEGGALDTTFSGDGKVAAVVGPGDDYPYAVAIDASGRIVVAGYAVNGSTFDFAVVRFTASGALDTSFSADGKVITPIGTGNDVAQAVAVDAAGRIIVAGHTWNGSDYDVALVRYTANGGPDGTFDGDGKVVTKVGPGADLANALAIDASGRLLVGGASSNGSNTDFLLLRYGATGALDATFGGGAGRVTTPMSGGADVAYGLAVDGSGRIVLAGSAVRGFALARYLAD